MKMTCVFPEIPFLVQFSYGKHIILKKRGYIDVHALNVGPFMSPVCCTIVILPHFFSQINLSLILRLQIKIYFISLSHSMSIYHTFYLRPKKVMGCGGGVIGLSKNLVKPWT